MEDMNDQRRYVGSDGTALYVHYLVCACVLMCVCVCVWCRSRLAGLFQLLERLSSPSHDVTTQTSSSSSSLLLAGKCLSASASVRYSADDVQQLRYLTSKILQYINAQGALL